MDPVALIGLLSDGEFHSGSELGRRLGVSRTAIWKSLDRLSEFGLALETVKGKGYRLPSPIELIDPDKISTLLDASILGEVALHYVPVLESTNSQILPYLHEDVFCSVLLSEMQTKGRGRRGRAWVSPFGQNIYMSVGFLVEGGAEAISGLSLVVGISVADAVRELTGLDIQLKWPNDLMLDNQKLAGLLIELQGEVGSVWQVVAGIGLNYSMTQDQGQEIDQPWVALKSHTEVSRNALCAKIIDQCNKDLMLFRSDGFAAFASRWQRLDFFKGKMVKVLGSELSGEAGGIDSSGNLLLRSDSGLVPVNAGEVSVRQDDS